MASVYFVTGKLGSGKTLTAVGKIREAFLRGVPVATNLDINLKEMLGRDKRNTRLYRLPDKPKVDDLKVIGSANKSYDTTKDGLIVLDECGTWFNSRTWNDKSRQELIDHLLHIRKLGWDVIFIVQDISIVDKQARLALAEHTVFCRRLDRMKVPFISAAISIVTLGQLKLKMPKLHIGIVKYGDNANSLTVDKWPLWGTDLYAAYDTKQMFRNNYEDGVYSVLPPYYTHGRYTVPYTLKNIMRITKIYLRKYSRFSVFVAGVAVSFAVFNLVGTSVPEPERESTQSTKAAESLRDMLDGFRIESSMNPPNVAPSFVLVNEDVRLSSSQLYAKGYTAQSHGSCSITVSGNGQSTKVMC
ncbi:assembly protein [Vibrio campbellii]|uniref:zonular occludens toxin domain-containing protein n=1 Tax=Vibrio campbellii TaxID=680 RepID=UPI0005311C3C|nr:zonular occludens toxin domain-containing protein [Vibrio campbellii]KGR35538.1 assembly protein [Vibrio campbellii]